MPGQCDDDYGCSFDWQAVSGKVFLFAPGSHVYEPHHTNQDTGHASHHQVHQKDAFQFLTFEFPLPRDNSRDNDGQGGNRCDAQVVVSRHSQKLLSLPLRQEIKEDTDAKQRDWKVNQHNVLCMLGEKYRFDVKRMHRRPRSLNDDFAGHLWVYRTKVGIGTHFAEGERELLVRVEHFGFEGLRIIRANDRVRDIVTVDPGHRSPDGHRQRRWPEAEVVDLHFDRWHLFLRACT
jgi:hypothetical protein